MSFFCTPLYQLRFTKPPLSFSKDIKTEGNFKIYENSSIDVCKIQSFHKESDINLTEDIGRNNSNVRLRSRHKSNINDETNRVYSSWTKEKLPGKWNERYLKVISKMPFAFHKK